MSTEIGGLNARIGMNTTGLRAGRTVAEAELLKTEGAILRTEKSALRLGGTFSKVGRLAGAVAGFELLKLGAEGIKGATEYAIELEATMGRVRNVFKGSTEDVVKFADTSDKALGRTKDAALQTSVRFGTLGTQFGETAEQAAKSSIALTKLATDLAASKGTSVDQAENALATGLVGRGRALRLYGVDVAAATVKQEALKEGLIHTVKDALTPAMTYQASYNLIMAQSANVQGYFTKHLDNTAEKLAVARATMRDASEEMGLAFAPAAKAAADVLANDVAPALKTVGEGIGFLGDHKLTRDVVLFGGGLGLLAVGIAKVGTIVKETRGYFAEFIGTTEAKTAAIRAEGAAAEVAAGQLLGLRDAELAAAGTPLAAGAGGGIAPVASKGGRLLKAGGLAVGGVLAGQALKSAGAGDTASAVATDAGYGAAIGSLVPGIGTGIGAAGGALVGVLSQPDPGMNDWKRRNGWNVPRARTAPRPVAPAILRLSPVEAAGANARASHDALIAAQQNAGAASVLQGEAGIVGGTLGGAFDALPTGTKGDPVKAADALAAANMRLANAQARVDALSKGSGGASRGSLLAAQAAVLSAEDTLRKHKGDTTAQTLRLQAAEDRLAKLRAGGGMNTAALARAEGALTIARHKADEAAKAAVKAGASTGLSVKDVLGRLGTQLAHTQGLAADSKTLIKDGISQPVLEQLDILEKTAPGTLARVAKGMTPAFARALNSEYGALDKARADFISAPLQAGVRAAQAKAMADMAALGRAQRKAYMDALVDGTSPNHLVAGPGGRVLAPAGGHPGSVSTTYSMPNATIVAPDPAALARALAQKARLGALSGSPTGHGV